MSEPIILLVLIVGFLILGVLMIFGAKKSAIWEAKINLWPWYKFMPEMTNDIYGKKEDLENSFAVKVTIWWHRFIGTVLFLFGLMLIILFLKQLFY